MKNMFRKVGLPVLLLGTLSVIIYACNKDSSSEPAAIPPGQQRVSLLLTDDPGLFDKVNIDIRKVEVLIDTCAKDKDDDRWDDRDRCGWWEDRRDNDDDCEVWDSLGIRPGVYDLLQLRNGVDTNLATGTIRKGRIEKIRITLGTNNSLVKDSISYPLRSVNGQVKLVIKVRHNEWDQISPDNLQLWLDFDVQRSIIQVSRGTFILKPVIHVWTVKQTGAVSGKVLPKDAQSIITVYNNLDSLYAIPGRDGEYKVRGLKPGTYSVFVNAGNGYRDTTIADVKVERAKETKVPTITVKK
ncbi:DUF4382 domain-containing protein [Chitinophaga niabensis]|uniref:DUF4382 domain-containing protein n=1 Tax=Chitinophaga niabensis TaxID=536979 RepID=A0A1N6ETI9_9BACT|nr:DUF4382 domain-containing protein [Chitinophaga niabensis]SIN86389.1 protein of unknown function [Chitinophaga niabensis]